MIYFLCRQRWCFRW